jgi:hypothetical protein
MKLFDLLKCINVTKINPFRQEDSQESKSEYKPYIINRCLSYFPDTIFYANEMNLKNSCDPMMQFDYYLSSVRKRKRYSPWIKKEISLEIEAIKEYMNCSDKKAREYNRVFSQNIKDDLLDRLEKSKNPK